MSHIFISYSRADQVCAYKIQRQLEAQGFKIWIDKSDLVAGAPFPADILHAISQAAAVIVVWSANAAASHFVGKEIEEALNQKMRRSIPIIPVWLDKHSLHPQLENHNAINFTDCPEAAVDTLIDKLPDSLRKTLGRQRMSLDITKSLGEQEYAQDLGQGLVRVPYLASWFCHADVVGEAPLVLSAHLSQKETKPILCVVPQFLGDTTDGTIWQVYNSIQTDLEGQSFLCLHIIPNKSGRITIDIHERGQALDAARTTYEAVYALVGGNRNLATIKIFTPMMSALSGSISYLFDSFWHVQEYHFERAQDRYYLLLDTKDL